MALVLLAGKVNLAGELYLSKNIPYTIETLAIEFNRDIEQVKLALDVLIELEMVELTGNNIYRIKNFAKHQNIKVKEQAKCTDKEDIKNKEIQVKENFEGNIDIKKVKEPENEIKKIGVEKVKNKDNDIGNFEVIHSENNKVENTISSEKNSNSLQNNIPISLETKKNNKNNKKKTSTKTKDSSIHITEEENEDNSITCFYDGEKPLGEGEMVFAQWSFA